VHFFTLLLGLCAVAGIINAIPVVKGGCAQVRKKLANTPLAHRGHWMARRRYHGRHAISR
jgi:hypothetical protein